MAFQEALAFPNSSLKAAVGALCSVNSAAQQEKMLPVGPGEMQAQLPAPLGTLLGGSREQLPLTDARLLLLPRPPGGHWKSSRDIFGTCRYSVLTPLSDNTDPIA